MNGTKVFDGYCLEIVWLLSEIFNFTYTLEEAYDFGAKINGSWSGMVGQTMKKVNLIGFKPLSLCIHFDDQQRDCPIWVFATSYLILSMVGRTIKKVILIVCVNCYSSWFQLICR